MIWWHHTLHSLFTGRGQISRFTAMISFTVSNIKSGKGWINWWISQFGNKTQFIYRFFRQIISDNDKEKLVIEKILPPPLHIKLGVVNHLQIVELQNLCKNINLVKYILYILFKIQYILINYNIYHEWFSLSHIWLLIRIGLS